MLDVSPRALESLEICVIVSDSRPLSVDLLLILLSRRESIESIVSFNQAISISHFPPSFFHLLPSSPSGFLLLYDIIISLRKSNVSLMHSHAGARPTRSMTGKNLSVSRESMV